MGLSGVSPATPLPLPQGAVMLTTPVRIKTGGWVEQTVDARLDSGGLTWMRVEGGFGDGRRTNWNPREDWVAIVPALSLHVGRYFSTADQWRPGGATIFEAIAYEIDKSYQFGLYRIREAESRLDSLRRGMALIAPALTTEIEEN